MKIKWSLLGTISAAVAFIAEHVVSSQEEKRQKYLEEDISRRLDEQEKQIQELKAYFNSKEG